MSKALLLVILTASTAFADEVCMNTCFDARDLGRCLAACNNRNEAAKPREPEPQYILPRAHRCSMPLYVNGVRATELESDECEDGD